MKDYASMSDFEINCHVAMALGMKEHFFMDAGGEDDFDDEIPLTERGPIWQTCKYRVGAYKPSNGNCFNPCNNPADAWPIITENRISTIYLGENEWGCRGDGDKSVFRAINSNALRCAMILFLMMKEGEK